ncbi:MAG: FMN-binding protein [Eubacteriales bacterium]|nr:FMN-binding protein [Eubacteriales bacterium]
MNRKLLSLLLILTLLFLQTGNVFAATIEGDANVDSRNYPSVSPFIHPPFYNVKVLVEVDENGKIVSIKDNGTGLEGSLESKDQEEKWVAKNKPYWDVVIGSGALDKFIGKTAEEVAAMQFENGQADAVSGATMAGVALQEAVLNAFAGKAGKTFLPGTGAMLKQVAIEGNTIQFENRFPEDFALELLDIRYSIYNNEENVLPADSYTFSADTKTATLKFKDITTLAPGKYYINVVDSSNKYRAPHFESGHGEEDMAQAPHFIIESNLKTEDISTIDGKITLQNADIKAWLANIEHVIITPENGDAIEQEIIGHHGTVNTRFNVLTEDGAINPAASTYNRKEKTENPIFESGKNYQINIASFGFPEIIFTYTAK